MARPPFFAPPKFADSLFSEVSKNPLHLLQLLTPTHSLTSPCTVNLMQLLDKRTSKDTEGAGIWGDSLGAIFHIKLSQGAFRGNPPVSLVLPVSLLVGFPETCLENRS